jgi:hypothetical protein
VGAFKDISLLDESFFYILWLARMQATRRPLRCASTAWSSERWGMSWWSTTRPSQPPTCSTRWAPPCSQQRWVRRGSWRRCQVQPTVCVAVGADGTVYVADSGNSPFERSPEPGDRPHRSSCAGTVDNSCWANQRGRVSSNTSEHLRDLIRRDQQDEAVRRPSGLIAEGLDSGSARPESDAGGSTLSAPITSTAMACAPVSARWRRHRLIERSSWSGRCRRRWRDRSRFPSPASDSC